MPEVARQRTVEQAWAQTRDQPRDQAREPHVLSDQGGVNARILAREAKVDFRRIEAASLKLPSRFNSAEGKRLFVRLFNTLQLNAHFVSVIARTKLDAAEILRTETTIRSRMEAATATLNDAIDEAEAQCKAQGITGLASYDALPLEVDVHVMSSTGRRYLELLVKLDQLMPMLQTLEIHEVLSTDEVDQRRARIKRQVRDVATHARRQAMLLRRRMNAGDVAGGGLQVGAREAARNGEQDHERSDHADGARAQPGVGERAVSAGEPPGETEGDLVTPTPWSPGMDGIVATSSEVGASAQSNMDGVATPSAANVLSAVGSPPI
jgi:hypothetical protein